MAAVNALDAKALRVLMAEDYSVTTTIGRTLSGSKEAMIARWTAAPPPGERGVTTLIGLSRVHVAGDAGFVSGTIEDRTITNTAQTCLVHAFTDIWERRRGTWVWVHSHESGAREAACEGEMPPVSSRR